jgi:hypothetical protein
MGGGSTRLYKLVSKSGSGCHSSLKIDLQGRVGAPPALKNLFQISSKISTNSKNIAKHIKKVKFVP